MTDERNSVDFASGNENLNTSILPEVAGRTRFERHQFWVNVNLGHGPSCFTQFPPVAYNVIRLADIISYESPLRMREIYRDA